MQDSRLTTCRSENTQLSQTSVENDSLKRIREYSASKIYLSSNVNNKYKNVILTTYHQSQRSGFGLNCGTTHKNILVRSGLNSVWTCHAIGIFGISTIWIGKISYW